jgi:hypothetical protein
VNCTNFVQKTQIKGLSSLSDVDFRIFYSTSNKDTTATDINNHGPIQL